MLGENPRSFGARKSRGIADSLTSWWSFEIEEIVGQSRSKIISKVEITEGFQDSGHQGMIAIQ